MRPTILVCIPIARRLWTPLEANRVYLMRTSLGLSLSRVVRRKLPYQIRVILNGKTPSNDQDRNIADAFRSLLRISGVSEVQIFDSIGLGKISAVNTAILDPCAAGVVVVDDDILVPSQAFSEIESFLGARQQACRALCFPKAPVFDGSRSTLFNTQLKFLLHPAMQRLLLECGFLQPLRPSGSLYAIHGGHLERFPDPCNEADVFTESNIKISCHFARTWYPDTFEEEVRRRQSHMLARKSSTPSWRKPLEHLDTYTKVIMPKKQLSVQILSRIHVAIQTMRAVISAATHGIEYADS